MNYYNEKDPFAAAWLGELIKAKLIPDGKIDTRSIIDVRRSDLRGFIQCHFFAGIGGWPLAFRLAGWPDKRPVWSASCPCQPLSGAGLRQGHADERHLWPAFYRLIPERDAPTIFGEQVASDLGREWTAGIRADMEALGHAFGAADLCAASIGAPHIRQRIYWVSYPQDRGRGIERSQGEPGSERYADQRGAADGSVAYPGADGLEPGRRQQCDAGGLAGAGGGCSNGDSGVADTSGGQLPIEERGPDTRNGPGSTRAADSNASGNNGGLADADAAGTARLGEHGGSGPAQEWVWRGPCDSRIDCGLGDADGEPGRLAEGRQDRGAGLEAGRPGEVGRMDNAAAPRFQERGLGGEIGPERDEARLQESAGRGSPDGRMGDAEGAGFPLRTWHPGDDGAAGRPYPWQGFEQASTVPIRCSDGRWRRVPANEAGEPEPALFPLAHAGTVRNRVGLLRGSGNAINPFLAREFIQAAEEAAAVDQ